MQNLIINGIQNFIWECILMMYQLQVSMMFSQFLFCVSQERNVNVIGVEERYVMNENDLNAVLKEGEGIKQFTGYINYYYIYDHCSSISTARNVSWLFVFLLVARRHMAETKQNDRSSRSHCILRVVCTWSLFMPCILWPEYCSYRVLCYCITDVNVFLSFADYREQTSWWWISCYGCTSGT